MLDAEKGKEDCFSESLSVEVRSSVSDGSLGGDS